MSVVKCWCGRPVRRLHVKQTEGKVIQLMKLAEDGLCKHCHEEDQDARERDEER